MPVQAEERTATLRLGRLERLPELYPVPVAVLDPGEATIALVLALRVDPDASGAEVQQERVEVVDAVVDHRRLIPLTEVGRVHREWIPGRHARSLRHFVLPPEGRTVVADLDAQVLRVPGSERLRVRAPQEHASDPCYPRHVVASSYPANSRKMRVWRATLASTQRLTSASRREVAPNKNVSSA